MQQPKNIAYIDGQNLHLGITSEWWNLDLARFRVFLKDRFHVDEAYYFLGCLTDDETDLYSHIQRAGFILVFREHSSLMLGKKKGNVDVDIVFEVMKKLYIWEDTRKIVLVSWDGDYYKMVKFLISEGKLERIIFPNKHHSSLYKVIRSRYGINLSLPDFRAKLEYKRRIKKEGS
jgi:uncharacterized LabA/DUF88 family protein